MSSMGDTRRVMVQQDGQAYTAEVLLETAEIIIRGGRRSVIPFGSIRSIEAKGGLLTINGTLTLELGEHAARWLEKIRNPKSVVQKLGVKPGHNVALVGLDDASFAAQLESAGALVITGKPKKNSDAIFYAANSRDDLERMAQLKQSLAPNGALWIIRPKGMKTITEADVMAAGKMAGLVDVKVVRFSETHTAEKFVIPAKMR